MKPFINRRGTQIRVLYFDRSGFCLWAKRLEAGRFNRRIFIAEPRRGEAAKNSARLPLRLRAHVLGQTLAWNIRQPPANGDRLDRQHTADFQLESILRLPGDGADFRS